MKKEQNTSVDTIEALAHDKEAALIVVDVQPDFFSKGALAIAGGEEILPRVRDLMRRFQNVVVTQDSHPVPHISFASSFLGKKPFETIDLKMAKAGELKSEYFSQEDLVDYLSKAGASEQTLWPDHCVLGTAGWKLDKSLPLEKVQLVLRKGWNPKVDSLSAFFENDGSSTGLGACLRSRGIRKVVVCGLAGDICAYLTARDAIRESLEVYFDREGVRYVDPGKGKTQALKDLETRGVHLI